MKLAAIDFEFYDSNEKDLKLVAAVICTTGVTLKYNLLDPVDKNLLISDLRRMNEQNFVFTAYAAMAESRSFLSLGLDPLDFKWIDLYVEFLMLCNSNNKWNYGTYIDKEGNPGFSVPPKPQDEEVEENNQSTPKNLVNAAFKILNVQLDTDQKTEMRDLILSKDEVEMKRRMEEILDYCHSDTQYLIRLYDGIAKAFRDEGLDNFEANQLERGRYAAATAKCENLGIPINMELLNKIIEKTPEILDSHKGEVNAHFKFFVEEFQRPPITRKSGKIFTYKPTPAKKDMGAYQDYITSLKIEGFPRTDTGKFKSDKDTLEQWGYWGGLEALWKYNKTESCLKWFNKSNKDGFFDRVGSDSCVRPYYGIFGTQTGRNAAKAKTFPLAMSSWLRAIVQPPKGKYIVSADFSQQEVYIAAILSGDKNLLEAYKSGDVYLSFAKMAGLVPHSATKSSHKTERNLCKSTVLGLQFGMGHAKLKTKLRLDSGAEVSDEKTAELITAHKETFSDYWAWVREISNEYKDGNPLITSDGWVLFQDNPVITSVRNFPVQATGASMTRHAVVSAWERGLKVMCGLHDALYIVSDSPEQDSMTLRDVLFDSCAHILGIKPENCHIRSDIKVVSHDEVWCEEKGSADLKKLAPFLEIDIANLT